MKKRDQFIIILGLLVAGCANNQHHELYNVSASAIDTFKPGFNPLEGKVISTFINVRDTTMSTLYGNDPAADHAERQFPYADGDILTLVTWKQREDPYWFGGNIPHNVTSIEVVRFESGEAMYAQHADGLPESHNKSKRIRFITEIRWSE